MHFDVTDSDSAAYLSARHDFITAIQEWAPAQEAIADERVLGVIADYARAADGRLDRWPLDKVDELFAVHFTTLGDLDAEFIAAATPTMIAVLGYLNDQQALDTGDNTYDEIVGELEAMAPQFESLLASPEEAARTAALVRTMQHQGVSLEDSEAVTKWMTKFSRKPPLVQQRMINEALESEVEPPEPLDDESVASLAALRGPGWLDALGDVDPHHRGQVIEAWIASHESPTAAAQDAVAGLTADPEQTATALACLRACGDDGVSVAAERHSSSVDAAPALGWLLIDAQRNGSDQAIPAVTDVELTLATFDVAERDSGPAGLAAAFDALVADTSAFATSARKAAYARTTDILEALGSAVDDKARAKTLRKTAFQRRSAGN